MTNMPAAQPNARQLTQSVRVRLWIMMFLQYFAWGSWFVTMGTYISANSIEKGGEIFKAGFTGTAYGTLALAAIIAPFFVGMIADRFFSSERLLAVLHLGGAGLLLALSKVHSQDMFYFTLLAFFLCYMPTLALTNSLSFHHLPEPGKQFPGIRVLGTIGWIFAGLLIGHLRSDGQHLALVVDYGSLAFTLGTVGDAAKSIEPTRIPMLIGAAAQAVLGLYCFLLPHTPPSNRGSKVTLGGILGLDALMLMKQWSFAVFVIGSLLIAIPLQFYYNYTNFYLNDIGVTNAASKMTFGQMSEIFFMLLMPLFFVRLGVKYMLLIGMACWAARYALFAYGDPNQGMWMIYIGILLHGICYDFFFVTGQIYVDHKANPKIRGAAQGFIAFATVGVGAFIGATLSGIAEMEVTSGGHVNWRTFWLMPAAGAGAVMVLFALLFHDRDGVNGPGHEPEVAGGELLETV
jgi:nucleoside transporter